MRPLGADSTQGTLGVGLCARGDGCKEGSTELDPESWALRMEREPLACLVLRDPTTDEHWSWGWTVSEASCKAYRELYPDRFDCRDIEWESIR